MFQEILGGITPQFLRTFIHSRKPSAYDLEQVLQFFGDMILSVVRSELTPSAKFCTLSQIPAFKLLKSCIDQVVYQISLEKLFVHFLASAIVIFFVLEYLMGYIERGGWATYADTSWEFRATYVPVELRLAFYFLFHFRAWPAQPPSADGHILGTPNLSTPAESSARGRKRRAAKGEPSVCHRTRTNKFEPKLKAPRTGKRTATDIWLGDYPSRLEAANVYWIGAYYYNQHKRLSNEVIAWCKDNLPDINRQANLSTEEEKASWIRDQAERYRFVLPHPSSLSVEHRGGGSDIPVISWEGEGGSQTPMDPGQPAPSAEPIPFSPTLSMMIAALNTNVEVDLLPELPPADLTGADQGQQFGDLSIDDSVEGQFQGDQGSGSHQQGVQHLQQNYGRVTDLEDSGAGAEVGAVLQQDESEVHHALRASANHPQAVDLVSQESKELKFTDAIQSFLGDLIERGLDFEIQPRDSTEFSISFPSLRKDFKLTGRNYLAYLEIYKQGFKVTLK
jgi:hypothetical protein